VVDDVPDFALVVGSPARRRGWVGRAGHPLIGLGEGEFACPVTGTAYHEIDGVLLEGIGS
jgi:hypothetical protein